MSSFLTADERMQMINECHWTNNNLIVQPLNNQSQVNSYVSSNIFALNVGLIYVLFF